jgi:alpha-tubulin suppressor-like RCC1 family protein
MWKMATRWAWALGMAAALAACGGDGDDTTAPPPTTVTAVVGPQGGTVNGPDGVQVVVPAGALTQPTTIGIARSAAGAPAAPTDNAPAGPIYEFTPHDVLFNAPVTLRMPVPNGAASAEVFMASPGEGWQVNDVVTTAGVASWQRNTFSWGMTGMPCALPANNTDPYPCSYPMGAAAASATPAAAITRVVPGSAGFASGNAGSWTVNQAGTVSLTLNYRAAPDCGHNGVPLTGHVKLIRWNPAASPRVVQTVFDATVSLTPTQLQIPAGSFSDGAGGPAMRGVGSTTVDVSAHLTDAVNVFGFSFACNRPGKPVHRGGDLLTFIGALPPPVGPFTLGGTFIGLAGAGLVLQNNGGDNLSVVANATSFVFPSTLVNGTPYDVTVLAQPAGQTCSVQNGSGNATSNVTNVAIECTNVGGPAPLLATALAAGVSANLVVATDGTVWAWGGAVDPITGGYSRAAGGATQPVQVQGLSGVKAVALSGEAEAYYALHTDGTVSAWGLNIAGQLGDRTTTTRVLPVKVLQDASTPMDEVCSIAAAANILLMARETGCSPGQRAVAPGPWIVGRFANTTIGGDTSSAAPTDGAIARAVQGWPAGERVSWMRTPRASSTAPAVFFMTARGDRYVWGFNGSNLLGAGASTVFAGGAAGPVAPDGLFWSGTGRVELGRDFALALDETGSLLAVGRNLEYQLGNGTTNASSTLQSVLTLTDVSDFSAGQVSAVAITNGELWQWGWDWNSNRAITVPTRVGTGTGFSQVSAANAHYLAIGAGGAVYSWGSPFGGALGRSGAAANPAVVMRP